MTEALSEPTVHPTSLEGLLQLRQADFLKSDALKDEGQQSLCISWGPRIRFQAPPESNDEKKEEVEAVPVVHLDFGGNHWHRGLPAGVLPILQSHFGSTLQSLNLGGTDLRLADTLQVLATLPQLQSFHFGANGLSDTGASELAADFIAKSSTLTTLDLRYNTIAAIGCKDLCDGLRQQQQSNKSTTATSGVTKLYLEGNRLDDGSAVALAEWLADPSCPLQEVFLGANQIGPEGATALANALKTNQALTKLYLEGNRILEQGADAFAAVLTDLKGESSLKHLFCDNNEIGKEGSKRLAEALNSASQIGGSL